MAQQIDLLLQTQPTARYEFLDFGDYDETLRGQGLMVRVNPTRETTDQLTETWNAAKDAGEDVAAINNANTNFAKIAAALIPADDERLDGAAIDPEAFANFVRQTKDPAFGAWILKIIFLKVSAHFLAPNASRKVSPRGRVQ
jgi:hypothetical protein